MNSAINYNIPVASVTVPAIRLRGRKHQCIDLEACSITTRLLVHDFRELGELGLGALVCTKLNKKNTFVSATFPKADESNTYALLCESHGTLLAVNAATLDQFDNALLVRSEPGDGADHASHQLAARAQLPLAVRGTLALHALVDDMAFGKTAGDAGNGSSRSREHGVYGFPVMRCSAHGHRGAHRASTIRADALIIHPAHG